MSPQNLIVGFKFKTQDDDRIVVCCLVVEETWIENLSSSPYVM
jgi:hypothetical protein